MCSPCNSGASNVPFRYVPQRRVIVLSLRQFNSNIGKLSMTVRKPTCILSTRSLECNESEVYMYGTVNSHSFPSSHLGRPIQSVMRYPLFFQLLALTLRAMAQANLFPATPLADLRYPSPSDAVRLIPIISFGLYLR